MKRRIWNSIGIAVLAAAIAFSLIQLNIPVVKAVDGCPDAWSVGYDCVYTHSFWWYDNGVQGECHYECGSGGWPSPDIQNFLIIQEVVVNVGG